VPRMIWLYTPGSNLSRIEKALNLPVDCLILDLEDSIPANEKKNSREKLSQILKKYPIRIIEVGVRINGHETEYEEEDIEKLIPLNPDFIVIPKIENEQDLNDTINKISKVESHSALEGGNIKIFCIIETAKAIMNLEKIVFSHTRLNGVMFGAEDFTLDLGVERTREGKELFYARAKIAVCCAGARKEAIDTVFPDLQDEEGLIAETKEISSMGFTGKAIIHPSQIEPVKRGFTPSPSRLKVAKQQVNAFEEALGRGIAAVSVNGKMVDFPVYERAKKMVALSENIEKLKDQLIKEGKG